MKTVTYHDLEKAAPDIEMHGVAFHDGDAVDVEDSVADSLKGNRFFSFKGDGNKDPAPANEPAVDELDGMGIANLRDQAELRGINHDGKSKAQLRDLIREHDASQ